MKIEDLPIPESVKELLLNSGIKELFPPQSDAIKAGALEEKNLVLASPTASGKTLIAELCALKQIIEKGGKVLYLCPLRALANEKFSEFKKYTKLRKNDGGKVKVGISTGDYDSSDPWLGRYDVIVTTNEKADSLLRHRSEWMNEISLVIADEVHLLNERERGPTLEVVLARLMQTNPSAQILALSATIRNTDEIAEWLKAEAVTTDWRPVTLREGVLLGNEVQFKDGGAYRVELLHKDPVINLALNAIRKGGQALIFAGTRKNAASIAKTASAPVKGLLSKPLARSLASLADRILALEERTRISDQLAELVKSGVAYHHAGLSSSHRRLIEEAFRDGKIKVISATPTLAFGVNLPARTVIIRDYKRYEPGYGYYPISVLEYKQMAGRAGRPKYDREGEALLFAKTEEEREYLLESYVNAKTERIWSKLGVERILRTHVLSTIAAEYARTEQGLFDFFGRTFYAYQYDARTIRGLIQKILKFLYKQEMIDVDGEFLFATRFGKRTSELYIDPISAVMIRDALYNRAPELTNLSILHMVAHTPDMFPKLRPYRGEVETLSLSLEEHKDEFMMEAPEEWEDPIAYENFLGELKTALVLESWIGEVPEDDLIARFGVQPGDLFRLTETTRWLLYASRELALLFHHRDLLPRITELLERVKRGVERELLPLVQLEGVGRVRGRVLYNAGFKTIEDLKKADITTLTNLPLIGPRLAKRIKEQVGGLIKKEEWERLKKSREWKQKAMTEFS